MLTQSPYCLCPICAGVEDDRPVVSYDIKDRVLKLERMEAPNRTLDIDGAAGELLRNGARWNLTQFSFGFTNSRNDLADYQNSDPEIPGYSSFSLAQRAAARLAVTFWDDVIGADFIESTNPATALIRFSNTTTGPGQAWAYFPSNSGKGGDVWINPSQPSNLQLGFGQYGLTTLVHELGHSLGLAHPGDYDASRGPATYNTSATYVEDSRQYTVMSYFGANNTGADHIGGDGVERYPSNPLLHDIAAVQRLYGQETTTRTGNTIYGFGSNAGAVYDFAQNPFPVIAIWDAGGTDWIDFRDFRDGTVLDLNDGTFSNTAQMSRNVAIARGALIENGAGGAGNDRITGNELDNVLVGRGGNDTIDGGAGNDTAVFTGARSRYVVETTTLASGVIQATVRDTTGADGTDTLFNVEQLRFSDVTVPVTGGGGGGRTISVADASIAEGNSGTREMVFRVALSSASPTQVRVNYATADGTAVAGQDYTATSGTLIFAPGQRERTVSVVVRGDTAVEANETLRLQLSAPVGATIGQGVATGTIQNDDEAAADDWPNTVVGAPWMAVGTSRRGTIEVQGDRDVFAVWLVNGRDYVFNVYGQSTAIVGGSLPDPYLRLLNATGTEILADDDSGQGYDPQLRITNFAGPSGRYHLSVGAFADRGTGTYQLLSGESRTPTITVAPSVRVVEGAGSVTLTLRLDAVPAEPVVIDYVTRNGTAVAGSDYQSRTGSLTISPGQNQITLTVGIVNNTINETAENFFVDFTARSGGRFAANATTQRVTVTIDDDDRATVDVGDTPSTAGRLLTTGTIGTIGTVGDRDWFILDAQARAVYEINLTGAPSGNGSLTDPLLRIYDAQGRQVAFDDDSGEGLESFLLWQAPTTGRYFLSAEAFGSATGSYRLDLRRIPRAENFDAANVANQAPNIALNGGFVANEDVGSIGDPLDFYAFVPRSSGVMTAALHSLTADADIYLYQQVGSNLVQMGRSIRPDIEVDQIAVSVQAGTRYVLEVRPFAPQTDYALSVALTPAGRSAVLSDFSYTAPGTAPVTVMALNRAMTLTGGPSNDLLMGGKFADILRGGNGNDVLIGGGGNDTVEGGIGNDWLQGGLGGDRLDGGPGTDTATYIGADEGVRADLRGIVGGGEAEGDTFVSVENLFGSNFADTLAGDANNNVLWGGFGNDWLYGYGGNDTLEGGPGDDVLLGGPGRDRYRFTPGSGQDRVVGFEDGQDLLDYTAHPGVRSLANVTITAVTGGVRVAAGADSVLLLGVNRAQITAADFDFV